MKPERTTDSKHMNQRESEHGTIKVKKLFTIGDYMNEKKQQEIIQWLELIKNFNKKEE
jgi:transposase-like protein